jgi:TonB family protein
MYDAAMKSMLLVVALAACGGKVAPAPTPAPAPAPAPTPAPTADNSPGEIDRQMIKDAMTPVKPQIMACGDKAPKVKGTVKVSVKVGPDGKVTNVEIAQTPDEALGTCVAAAMQTMSFPATKAGGSFSYPLVF